jgi:hypothetical protein
MYNGRTVSISASVNWQLVMTQPALGDLWRASRSGARAGLGFRFQTAATVASAILCWSGKIPGNAIVPEGLDDFTIEGRDKTLFVQTKSKVSDTIDFSARDICS